MARFAPRKMSTGFCCASHRSVVYSHTAHRFLHFFASEQRRLSRAALRNRPEFDNLLSLTDRGDLSHVLVVVGSFVFCRPRKPESEARKEIDQEIADRSPQKNRKTIRDPRRPPGPRD